MIIHWIYETQNLLSLWLVSFLVGLRTYQQHCIKLFSVYASRYQKKHWIFFSSQSSPACPYDRCSI